MIENEYLVYWTEAGVPHSSTEPSLPASIARCKELRDARAVGRQISFITMVSECKDQVGENGVDSVEDGTLPNGEKYTYVKRRAEL